MLKTIYDPKCAIFGGGLISGGNLETRPSAFAIYDQECRKPALLEKDAIHFCPGSVALNVLDSETEKIRQPKLQDLIRFPAAIHRSRLPVPWSSIPPRI